jgi:hypothetical protein
MDDGGGHLLDEYDIFVDLLLLHFPFPCASTTHGSKD